MIIIHDFFLENGGGENLINSIAKKYNIKVLSAYSKKKNILIKESKLSFILKNNKFFTFLYYFFSFKFKTKKVLIFSGNHCVFANHKCVAKKKILYAHSLPKYLYSELYLGVSSNIFFSFFKNFLKKEYKKNILLFDEIIFNSKKTKSKFLSAFPELLNNKINLEVKYPLSEINFLDKNINRSPKNYLVVNSRHTPTKNITKIIINFLNVIKDKDMKIYLTHEGAISQEIKKEFLNYRNIVFTGYLDLNEYEKLLSESLGVIFPSIDEDFGISALDAYNLNIPVILYRNCGFSEILDKNYEFYIDDKYPDEIVDLLWFYNSQNKSAYSNKVDLKSEMFKFLNKYYE